ncbi:MAG: TonB-dependent receptor [Bacteroidota bacterium]
MFKKAIILLLLCPGIITAIYARQIEGKVYEKVQGEKVPITGANVVWLETNRGTTTDSEGEFLLNHHPDSDYLLVSFIGYRSDTIAISEDQNYVEVELEPGEVLGEVSVADRKSGTTVDRMETMHVENIAGEEMHKAACCNLSQSFETNASVDAAYSDAATGAKQIRLLGLSGRYVQMMTENFPNYYGLATAFGLEYIPGPWMDAIQVSKGTAAVTNGYDAITGQINVEYKKPATSEPLYANWLINDKGRTEVNLNGRWLINDKWSTMLMTHHGWSLRKNDVNDDNFMDHPLVDRQLFFARTDYNNHKGYSTRFGLKYFFENRLGGQLNYDPDVNPLDQTAYGVDINTKRYEAFWKNGYIIPGMKHTSIALINNMTYHEHDGVYGKRQYDATQVSYYGNLIWQSVLVNHQHTYHAGISMKYDQYDEHLDDRPLGREEMVPGAFLQYSMNLDNGLSAIAGLRADHHNLYGMFYTPRFHLKYKPNGITVFRASAGKGWRTANVLAENSFLLASSRYMRIDDNLLPEEAWNAGFSMTQYFMVGNQEWRATAEFYRTQFDNQLVVDMDSDVDEVHFSNLNGRSFSNTYQIELSAPLVKGLDLRTAYRYNDVQQNIGGVMREVPLTSRSKGFMTASYKTPLGKWQFDATGQYNGGGRIPSTAANPDIYQRGDSFDPYPMVHAQITKYFKSWSVYLGVENILNYRQENPIIAASEPFGEYFDAAMIWGPLEGRKFYLGFRWQLQNLNKDN